MSDKPIGNTMDENESGQRFHNVLGEEYDLLKMAMPHYDTLQNEIGRAVSRHITTKRTDSIKVLEIGPGSGLTTKVLLDCDSRTHITAVDNEEMMLAHMELNIKRWQAEERIILIKNEIGKFLTSVPDNSFDVIASGFVLHNFDDEIRKKIIKEIFRVLKPGGLFVNGDKYAHDSLESRKWAYEIQTKRFDVYDRIGRSDYKTEWLKHYIYDEDPIRIFVEGLAKEFMRKVGFQEVDTVYRDTMEAVVVGTK